MTDYWDCLDKLRERLHPRDRSEHYASWNGSAWMLCESAPQPPTLGLVIGPRDKLLELMRVKSCLRLHCIFAYIDDERRTLTSRTPRERFDDKDCAGAAC